MKPDTLIWLAVCAAMAFSGCTLPPLPRPPDRPPVPYYPATNMVDPVTQEVPDVILP
jgi:hypothetical protein